MSILIGEEMSFVGAGSAEQRPSKDAEKRRGQEESRQKNEKMQFTKC